MFICCRSCFPSQTDSEVNRSTSAQFVSGFHSHTQQEAVSTFSNLNKSKPNKERGGFWKSLNSDNYTHFSKLILFKLESQRGFLQSLTVAHPGFPRRGARQPLSLCQIPIITTHNVVAAR